MKPPVVVYLKPQPERNPTKNLEVAPAKRRPRELHHYETARRELTPIQFAEHILRNHGLLYDHHGHVFLDGKYATPAQKIDAANAILIKMRLAPIVLRRRP